MAKPPYDVIDVAEYIISYCNKQDYPNSNLRMQKILYFVQAYFLVNVGTPCFPDEIEAWNFGPVIPAVYKRWIAYPFCIPYIFYDPYKENGQIDIDDEFRIENVVDMLSKYCTSDLVKASQRQDPWREAYKHGERSIIPKENIKLYFKRLKN